MINAKLKTEVINPKVMFLSTKIIIEIVSKKLQKELKQQRNLLLYQV
jgi:hypothetical protein